MAHIECRKPATLAGNGLSCSLGGELLEGSPNVVSLQEVRALTATQRRERERAALRSAEDRAESLSRIACQHQARAYRAAALQLRAQANAEKAPTSDQLNVLATSFERRAAVYQEAAR